MRRLPPCAADASPHACHMALQLSSQPITPVSPKRCTATPPAACATAALMARRGRDTPADAASCAHRLAACLRAAGAGCQASGPCGSWVCGQGCGACMACTSPVAWHEQPPWLGLHEPGTQSATAMHQQARQIVRTLCTQTRTHTHTYTHLRAPQPHAQRRGADDADALVRQARQQLRATKQHVTAPSSHEQRCVVVNVDQSG
jgi:hypothetical protein